MTVLENPFVNEYCLISATRYLHRRMNLWERSAYIGHVFHCRHCREYLASLLPFVGEHRVDILRELRGGEVE